MKDDRRVESSGTERNLENVPNLIAPPRWDLATAENHGVTES